MDVKKELIILCRFCSSPCEENSKPIQEMSKILDILRLKLDLTVSENRMLCENCEENLQTTFEFKSMCLRVEDYVRTFVCDKAKPNLREIYINQCENESPEIPEDHFICRLCMKLADSSCNVRLSDETKDAISAKITLKTYFPEVDLRIAENPLICIPCHASLQSYFTLIRSCSSVEEQVKEIHTGKADDSKSQVNLNAVKHFPSINMFDNENEGHGEYKSANFIKVECQELDIVNEDLNFKTESDFARMPVTTFSTQSEKKPNPSEATCYKCELCACTCKLKSGIKKHMVKSHKNASKVINYQCEMCDFKTKYKTYLKYHMLIHKDASEVAMHQCEICQYETKHKHALKQHIMLIHQNSADVTVYHCDSCAFSTKSVMYLKRHVLVHNEKTSYHCELCTYKTRVKRYLYTHMLIHKDASEVTIFHCDVCDYKTKRKHCLKQHVLMHKDAFEVPMYQCEVCAFATKLKPVLNRHMVTHKDPSEVPMYQCEICGLKTKFKYALTRHMVTH